MRVRIAGAAAFVSMAELSVRVRIAGAAAFASMADGGASVQIARSAGARYASVAGHRTAAKTWPRCEE